MEDVKSKKCCNILSSGEQCQTRVSNNKYDGFCAACFASNGGKSIRFTGYKEKAVNDYLDNIPELKASLWFNNKFLPGTTRRPDKVYKTNSYYLVVEIDEFQHCDYDQDDEITRMKEICEAFDLPCYFIRFNPDDYKTKQGNVSSCWRYDKEGKPCVKKSKTQALDPTLGNVEAKNS